MIFHRLFRQTKMIRNLFVRKAFRNQLVGASNPNPQQEAVVAKLLHDAEPVFRPNLVFHPALVGASNPNPQRYRGLLISGTSSPRAVAKSI
jgi:hypothetical protein